MTATHLTYYKDNGATSDCIQDAEREFLITQGAAIATNQDMWYEFLSLNGYEGSLPDMWYEFWSSTGSSILDESLDPILDLMGDEIEGEL